jgi:2-polyprenyl-3-methyl-5-hydroxy-6-metoxy-1,4-benzoquinol methylase
MEKVQDRSIRFHSLKPHASVQVFCQLIAEEMSFRRLTHLDSSYLQMKYENMLFDQTGKMLPVGVMGYTERLIPLVTILTKMQGQARVLDVGSGCGSEALLMSLLGAEVTGIDLGSYKVDFARSRIPFYQSFSEDLLKIQFIDANVFHYLATTEQFNIIWLIEAISHIHPAEDFLQLAFNQLPDKGLLIISDSNALNPVSWLRSWHIRGSMRWYTYQQVPAVEGEEIVEVAEERIFSLFRFKKKLLSAGFNIKTVEVSGFMGSYLIPNTMLSNQRLSKALIAFQQIMKKTPILRLLGSNFTVVASK